jgi:hypothetical protein
MKYNEILDEFDEKFGEKIAQIVTEDHILAGTNEPSAIKVGEAYKVNMHEFLLQKLEEARMCRKHPDAPRHYCIKCTHELSRDVRQNERSRLREGVKKIHPHFWDDIDHTVGGYISKVDLLALLDGASTDASQKKKGDK